MPLEWRPGSFLLRDDCWGSGGSLDSDGASFGGWLFTSAAFCNPEAGLAALLSMLASVTQWDIQNEGRGIKRASTHYKLLSAFTFIMLNHSRQEAENIFNGSHSDVNASKDGKLLDGTAAADGKSVAYTE